MKLCLSGPAPTVSTGLKSASRMFHSSSKPEVPLLKWDFSAASRARRYFSANLEGEKDMSAPTTPGLRRMAFNKLIQHRERRFFVRDQAQMTAIFYPEKGRAGHGSRHVFRVRDRNQWIEAAVDDERRRGKAFQPRS